MDELELRVLRLENSLANLRANLVGYFEGKSGEELLKTPWLPTDLEELRLAKSSK